MTEKASIKFKHLHPSQSEKAFYWAGSKGAAKLTASCIPALVSCLDRVQACHLRRRRRTRSLPFSCFRPEICSCAGSAGLGWLSSMQAEACSELLGVHTKGSVGGSFLPSPLSGKTRHHRPQPSALGSFVAFQLGSGLNPAWTCAN